jgi:hypothetical protein
MLAAGRWLGACRLGCCLRGNALVPFLSAFTALLSGSSSGLASGHSCSRARARARDACPKSGELGRSGGDMQRPAGCETVEASEDTRHASGNRLRMSMDETNDYSARPRCCASLHCRAFLSHSALALALALAPSVTSSSTRPRQTLFVHPLAFCALYRPVWTFSIASHRSSFLFICFDRPVGLGIGIIWIPSFPFLILSSLYR